MTLSKATIRSGRAVRIVAAGLVAAAVSSIPGLVAVVAGPDPWWYPVQLIATVAGADPPRDFALPTLLLGGFIHLAISLGWALVFEFPARAVAVRHVAIRPLVPGSTGSTGRWIALGALFGAAVFAVDFGLFAIPGWFGELRHGTAIGTEVAAHLLFGISLALAWAALSGAATRPRSRR